MPADYTIADGPSFRKFVFNGPILGNDFDVKMRFGRILTPGESPVGYPDSGTEQLKILCVGKRPVDLLEETVRVREEETYFFFAYASISLPRDLRPSMNLFLFGNYYIVGRYNCRQRFGFCTFFTPEERAYIDLKKGPLGYLFVDNFNMGQIDK